MRIQHDFEYDMRWHEISDEFCAHDSEYQAEVINSIGSQFRIWTLDKARTTTHIQLLEIAEQLDDKGRWFIKTLCDSLPEPYEAETGMQTSTETGMEREKE